MVGLALRTAVFVTVVAASTVKRPSSSSGYIAVPLTRDEGLTAYFAELQVGTPPQKEYLKIDTGSPRYSVLDSRNAVCASAGQSCSEFGTFDNLTSSTCHYEGGGFVDDLSWVGNGDYLSDTIAMGGVTIEDMYFGYTSRYAFPDHVVGDPYTILGLSLECGLAGPTCTDRVSAYMLPELKNSSKINHMASSIYLGPDDKQAANAQMLLGGFYDKAKIDGELITIPMVDPFNEDLTSGQTNNVNVTAIEVVLGEGYGANHTLESYGQKDVGVPVLLDTGVANFYLTDKTVAPIYRAFGNIGAPSPGQQYSVVDCKYADPKRSDGHITVEFGKYGKVTIPLHALVSQFPDGTCGAFVTSRGDSVFTFGDPFLRGVYSIFDQENFSISLGQVKHTAEQNIVPFPKGGFKPTP
ncbi:hypothetical protein NLU13_8517 [Sarocladium strictum]|uniref:Peptidase A1 domain-containing protein n=1 Tax=Sarocladium strictum TaxID=5046 RepID=A0AA39GCD4_SARSR|nr:hypothetical protein NLU13_8517 [Sarocladium strictum]